MTFLQAAPFRYVNTVDLAVAAERMWAALTADDTLVSWTPLVTGLRWTTPRPFGVGTTREVTILRLLTSRERYHRWDQGRRKTFTVVEVSVPGLRRLAEDYVVERTPGGSRFIWTLALEPGPILKPILRLTNPITASMLRRVARGMRSQLV
jgi:Polyketide cyclase / dehydrase and lipid transport